LSLCAYAGSFAPDLVLLGAIRNVTRAIAESGGCT
jgi:hypothetical protein